MRSRSQPSTRLTTTSQVRAHRKLVNSQLNVNITGIPSIQLMRRVTQVGLYPREPAATKAGMGLLPFLVVTAGEGGEVKLPEMEAVKKEMFGCLRGVKRPTVVKAKDWRTAYDSDNWMPAATPEMIWPEYKEVRAPEGDGGSGHPGKYNNGILVPVWSALFVLAKSVLV